jgi:hypothetical protein
MYLIIIEELIYMKINKWFYFLIDFWKELPPYLLLKMLTKHINGEKADHSFLYMKLFKKEQLIVSKVHGQIGSLKKG